MITTKRCFTFFILIAIQMLNYSGFVHAQSVGPVPDAVRETFDLDPFYKKHLDVGGLPVVGSEKVSDAAILEAAWIVEQMLGDRPDILKAMAKNNTRLAVMAHNEYTTDIPEHRHLKSRVYWDRRARGLGASRSAPAVSCAEENLLCYPNDPYSTENICIHEFAHAIHSMGMIDVDPTFDDQLKKAFQDATSRGLWKNTYAASNRQEYWAEAVQSWFDDNRENDALHNHVNTRDELKKYDPELARLCEQVFGDGPWRYKKPMLREPGQRAHLKEVDFENLPRFQWRKESVPAKPKVLIQTTEGDIEVELDSQKAPISVENFLHYVHEGFYSNGQFHRTVTGDNQPDNKIKIAGIQASADPEKREQFPKPIVLERTRDTGLKHLDGTISMARAAPNSAQDHIFICVGDQPELDFGGKRNPDGQGFAAFGTVTKGMEVVKKIHEAPAQGQSLEPKILIQRAIRLN
jgi:cyclophilin family peptidyl-prolyl cis-trans isomerase